MSFFEPPPPEQREPSYEIPKPRPWWHAPGNELGEPVPLRLLLARTEGIAVALVGMVAYTTGIAFTLMVRSRRQNGEGLLEEPWDMPLGYPGRHRQAGVVPPEVLRFGVQFADGRKATTLSGEPPVSFPGEPEKEPSGPVLMPGGGGGAAGQWDSEFWLWPLPPAGPVTFAIEWPQHEIELAMHKIDATLLLEASRKSEVLWPDDGRGRGSHTVNRLFLEPADPEPESDDTEGS